MNQIRKNIALILSAMLMISLAGCGSSEGISEETATQTQLAQDQEAAKDEEQTAATVTEDTTSETEEGEISSTSDSAESDVTSTGSLNMHAQTARSLRDWLFVEMTARINRTVCKAR